MRVKTPTLAWRLQVAGRTVLAILGSYVAATLACVALSAGLPRLGVPRVEAAVGATLLAILALPVVPIFVFAARSTRRVALAFAACTAVAALMCWIVQAPR